jgi:hypothetical protein
MEEQPRLRQLASRCFEHAGDVDDALKLVFSSSGIQRSRFDPPPPPPCECARFVICAWLRCCGRALALEHAGAAAEAARGLAKITGNAHACSVLEALSTRVVKRLK